MTTARMETAADKYRRIRAEKQKGETLQDVHCDDCGMDWKGRRLSLDFWITSGILPMNLVQSMVKATQKHGVKDPADVLKTMAADEVFQSIVFMNKVVTHTAAEPCIVEIPKEPNEISQEEVLTCCYHRLFNWQMEGGDGAGLKTFPEG